MNDENGSALTLAATGFLMISSLVAVGVLWESFVSFVKLHTKKELMPILQVRRADSRSAAALRPQLTFVFAHLWRLLTTGPTRRACTARLHRCRDVCCGSHGCPQQ
mgnify:CR=1 FL=1